jgi:hypothetical protein
LEEVRTLIYKSRHRYYGLSPQEADDALQRMTVFDKHRLLSAGFQRRHRLGKYASTAAGVDDVDAIFGGRKIFGISFLKSCSLNNNNGECAIESARE